MFDFDYPKVKQSLGQAALQDPYPAWLLDSRGVIHAANLMAFWLWDTIRPGEPVKPDSLLGISVFNILADNLERIPVDQNVDFYMKRSAVVKRIDANLRSPLYASFIGAMKANPRIAQSARAFWRTMPTAVRKFLVVCRLQSLHTTKNVCNSQKALVPFGVPSPVGPS